LIDLHFLSNDGMIFYLCDSRSIKAMNFEQISSLQNPKIRNILKLQKASERRLQNLCTVEGIRELKIAVLGGNAIKQFFFCPEIAGKEIIAWIRDVKLDEGQVYEISKPVFERVAYRDSTEGIYALVEQKSLKLDNIKLKNNPLVLVIESVEKPGNLGAILRTADAACLDAILICDPQTDIYNPNVIRSSIGAVFVNQVSVCSSIDAIKWLKRNGLKSFAAAPGSKSFYHEANFNTPSAIIMGSEATGLSKTWLEACDEQILIPMLGKMDSLNVSTSAAILIFEAMRQRGFKVK
jgi:TrmH family RNA methyltransferase